MAKTTEILELKLQTEGGQNAEGLSDAIGEIGRAAGSSAQKAAELVDELAKLERISKLAAEFTRSQAALDKLDNEVAQASAGIRALNQEFDGTAKRTGDVGKAYRNAEKILADLTRQQEKQRAELARTEAELKKAGVDTAKLADESARLDRETIKATKDLVAQSKALQANREAAERQAKAFEALGKNVAAARTRLNEMALSFTKVTSTAAAGAAALAAYGTGRFFAGALQEASDFEHTIKGVAAAAGGSADDLRRLSEAAEDAGKGLGFTGQQGAEALQALARAGLDVNESIGALPATLALARAGQISVVESANRLADTLDQFGLAGNKAAETADKIAKAAFDSGTSVAQFTDALATAAPTARGAGASFEVTAAALGVLAENGIEGSRAGAALAQIFTQLQDPSSAFVEALRKAGIQSRDFVTVIEALAKGGKGTQEAIQALGTRGTSALQALVRDGGGAIRNLAADFTNAQGAAARLAEMFSDDVAVAFLEVNRAYEAARKSLLQPILEPLANELNELAKQIDAFAETAEFERLKQQIVSIFNEGVDAAKRFIAETDFKAIAAQISSVADSIVSFVGQAKTYFDELQVGVGLLKVAFNGLETGIYAITAALAKAGQLSAQWISMQAEILEILPSVDLVAEAIGVDLESAAKKAADAAAGLQGVYDEFSRRTVANANETRSAIDGVSAAIDGNAGASQEAAAAATARGNAEVEAATASAAANVQAGQQTATAIGAVAIELQKAVAKSAELAVALQSAVAGGATKDAIDALKVEFAAANAEVSKLESSLTKVPQALAQTPPAAAAAAQSIGQVKGSVDEAAESVGRFQADFERAGYQVTQSTSNVVSILTALNQEFGSTSESARQLFVEIYNGGVRGATSVRAVFDAIQNAAATTRRVIGEQTKAIGDSTRAFADLAEVSDEALARTYQATQLGADGLREMAQATREGKTEFGLLNQADLDKLAGSIDAVASRVDALTAKAEQARRALADIERQQQDEADRRAGNTAAIEERNFLDEMARIDELQRTGGDGVRTYAERARALLRANHEANLREIAAEAEAREAALRREREELLRNQQVRKSVNDSGPSRGSGGSGPVATTNNFTINANGIGATEAAVLIRRQIEESQRRRR